MGGITESDLRNAGFELDAMWTQKVKDGPEISKVDFNDIIPGQLTVCEGKVNKAGPWIRRPEDVVMSCQRLTS